MAELQRKIIHVDMDAFYASVEQRDNPELLGKPIAVGGSEKRGVVSAASYEARKFGVFSAMSGVLARKRCPNLIFVKPRYARYREVSDQIREIFLHYTDLVEPLSLDEAYLDVTENKINFPSATLIAAQIRKRIWQTTGLTASAGISINKFIAKVASDINKPNGQKTVPPEEVLEFLEALEIKKFYGVGKVTAEKMYRMGIFTGKDLKARSEEFLSQHFGKSGAYYYQVVRGVHNSAVKPSRTPKSVGAERTFSENLSSELYMMEKLEHIAGELHKRLEKHGLAGKTITLKIKYSDFNVQTRSRTFPDYISDKVRIVAHTKELLFQETLKNSVRLLGISLSGLNTTDDSDDASEQAPSISEQLQLDF